MGNMEQTVTVTGTGKSREEAFAKAMTTVQQTLSKRVKGIIIRIEPLEVHFVEGRETTTTERFLLFFFKREVSTFTIKVNVRVNVFVVDIDGFEIEKVKETRIIKKLLR